MNNSLVLLDQFNNIDLYSLEENEIIEIKDSLIENIKISDLEKKVKEAILKLSSVSEPCFGADIKVIAFDNQKRLELIYSILNSFENFKIRTRNYKRNKMNCNENYEGIFEYLSQTQELLKSIYEYADFRHEEKKEADKIVSKNRLMLKDEKCYG